MVPFKEWAASRVLEILETSRCEALQAAAIKKKLRMELDEVWLAHAKLQSGIEDNFRRVYLALGQEARAWYSYLQIDIRGLI